LIPCNSLGSRLEYHQQPGSWRIHPSTLPMPGLPLSLDPHGMWHFQSASLSYHSPDQHVVYPHRGDSSQLQHAGARWVGETVQQILTRKSLAAPHSTPQKTQNTASKTSASHAMLASTSLWIAFSIVVHLKLSHRFPHALKRDAEACPLSSGIGSTRVTRATLAAQLCGSRALEIQIWYFSWLNRIENRAKSKKSQLKKVDGKFFRKVTERSYSI